jgi:hypothetical protein
VREDQKEKLDELKNERRKQGEDPSYSDILDEIIDETSNSKKKEKEGRDFMELF